MKVLYVPTKLAQILRTQKDRTFSLVLPIQPHYSLSKPHLHKHHTTSKKKQTHHSTTLASQTNGNNIITTTPPPPHHHNNHLSTTTNHPSPPPHTPLPPFRHRRRPAFSCTYKVIIEHQGEVTELEVDDDETILSKALDHGMSVPHDCKLGVCMTCPAKLVDGVVDQTEGMLSDDVVERGFALLCASYPRSDCRIKTIPEEELLAMQLATAND